MAHIELEREQSCSKVIMIFTEGTILRPRTILSLYNHRSYIPIGNSVSIINKWCSQGAKIIYCTSRRNKQALYMAELLKIYGFIGASLYYRTGKEKYKDIVESVKPDIIIEDDCRSIGGSWQMCITNIAPELKMRIKSVVVKEFGGIDDLPEDFTQL